MKHLILFSFLLTTSAFAQEAVYMQWSNKNLKSGKTEVADIYANNNKVVTKDGSNSFIFDARNETFMTVDDKKKEYIVMTKSDLNVAKEQFKQMATLMQTQLQNLPEAQRKAMEKQFSAFLGDGEMPEVTYKKTGNSKVKSWSTDKYDVFEDGNKTAEVELSSFETLGISKSDFQAMEKLADFITENLSEFTSMVKTGGGSSFLGFGDENSPIFQSGIPVKVVNFSSGSPDTETIVTTVDKKNVDSSVFEVPKGYKKTSLQEMMQGSFFGR
ncbi:MAG: hypothetical protein AAF363_01605 [Bacteroidota bacterium]